MRRPLFALLLIAPALAACGPETPAPTTPPTKTPPATTATPTPTATPAPTPTTSPVPAAPAAKTVGTSPGSLVPAFTVEGTAKGAASKVESQKPGVVTVYCAGSTTCPYTNKYAEKMQQVEASFAGQAVNFVWLYPNSTETADAKTKWHAEKGLGGTFVVDTDAAIAKTLNVKRTPELIVTAADGTITYRGAIDDGAGDPKRAKVQYLSDAIRATLAGQAVKTAETTPAG